MKSMNWRLPPVVRRSLAGKQVPLNASPAPPILVNAGWCLNSNVTHVRLIRVRTMLNVWPGSARAAPMCNVFLCLLLEFCCETPDFLILQGGLPTFRSEMPEIWSWLEMERKCTETNLQNGKPKKSQGATDCAKAFNQKDVRNAVFYSFSMTPCFSQSQSAQTPIEASAWRRSRKRTTHAPETEKVFGDLGFRHLCLVLKLWGISKSTYPMMNLK